MTTANFGFAITRNGNKYEFFSTDEKCIESWTNALKGICVLTNFHDEYKAQKMIGKGSFAKVSDSSQVFCLKFSLGLPCRIKDKWQDLRREGLHQGKCLCCK